MAFVKGLKLDNAVIAEINSATDEIQILTLDTEHLKVNNAEILATPAEINQALSGVSANVSAANLSTLTGTGNADALHTHTSLETEVYTIMTNSSTLTAIPAKSVVYATSEGKIALANASSINTAKTVLGVVETEIPAGAAGKVTLFNSVENIGVALPLGSRVYLSTEDGQVTTTPPSATGNVVLPLGIVKNATDIILNIGTPVILA